MDRRSWPWKKKSSEKTSDKTNTTSESAGSQGDQDGYKKPSYVQISVETYSQLTGLEDQVKIRDEQIQTLEGEIKDLNEKLSAAQSEMTTKDNLVKQHAKVAEEAVSGWEKAEAEALALKNHLETVTLSKLTAEDRASHLDGALKECMRQIRSLKEEHELKLQEVMFTKTKQWDKIKLEFESKMADLDQELLRSAAENAALSRSLQERSNMLIKISEEKSQAEADIEMLKGNIESCEREINSLKYELHIVSKELEIRNEEKNMSMRSAEAANKQHMEVVKKITKMEAECQRLRGLVRKKLPGPAALAQMKLEVESLGREYGDTRVRKSPSRPPTPHILSVPEFSLDNSQKFQKENEFLTERLLAMEEETKMLKEALAKRNSELQTSRSLCAKTASKLQSLEMQLQNGNHQRSSPKSVVQYTVEGFSCQSTTHPPSLTSMSEDGNEDGQSCADSLSIVATSDISQFREMRSEKLSKTESGSHLGLMDDFLEMEKLACLSNESNGAILASDDSNNKASEVVHQYSNGIQLEHQLDSSPSTNAASSTVDLSTDCADSDGLPLMKLRSRISTIFECISKDADTGKILEDIKCIVQDAHDALQQPSVSLSCASKEVQCPDLTCDRQANPDDAGLGVEREIALSQSATPNQPMRPDLEAAISQVHEFVLLLGKEASRVHDTVSPDGHGLGQRIEEFSATFNKFVYANTTLVDFVIVLSHVLSEASELRFSFIECKDTDGDTNSPDCIDKVALPEHKVVQNDPLEERYTSGCSHISSPTSDLEVPCDGNLVSSYESNSRLPKLSAEDIEELKLANENLSKDLARSTEDLEATKHKLQETEQLLAESRSQLALAQKSNSLSETQLKCMVESYRSLEARSEDLETEQNLLRAKSEALDNELQDEKRNHHEALSKCKELQEQLQRNEACATCSSAINDDPQKSQEIELTAAAEKLAECQETIFLLSKQLKSLRPQPDFGGSPFSERSQRGEEFNEDEPSKSGTNLVDLDQSELDTAASAMAPIIDAESPCSVSDSEGGSFLMSPSNSKHPKHRPTKSSSSSSSSAPTPEKHARGFSRFFSSKGKNSH
ncbi:filament-like plant protein 4 [Cucurbita maxima]|uniref:Filament-like plant protein 4 n=1 Tax=Cucurbita maxima TaxID=3661 RepID=A0A6J1J0J1_CUCMA|nr:filament-like plant protein 4 [Cucurbita maxima]XP_022981759.1 filament-like plant protein 4 [Cucurbita maxima]XP_022981760.1 filament-like plant protein 4 [Cucurbita maxima]XP_022981761.1 filament-like plant protein 4 [Cucurbita maxima]